MKTGLENLHASLDEGKIQHVFYESPGTDHEWQTWRRDLKDFRTATVPGAEPTSHFRAIGRAAKCGPDDNADYSLRIT